MKLLKVLNKDLTSPYQGFEFELGKKYVCNDFDTSDNECSKGFYAVDFNGLVYAINNGGQKHSVFEVEVGGCSKEFSQFKRRYEEITIIRELTEDEIKAGLLACEEKEGYRVYEACYPIHPFVIEPIPLEDAKKLLQEWKKVSGSVRYSVWYSVSGSVGDSVWASVGAYVSSLFPNIKKWKYIYHEECVNPFQAGIDLWKGGYVPSFDGKTWRLHTKDGIVWEKRDSTKN